MNIVDKNLDETSWCVGSVPCGTCALRTAQLHDLLPQIKWG